jgi:hypothetical protein
MCLCIIFIVYFNCSPIPVAGGSKVWACDRSLTGNAGSNPQGVMDVSYECCVLSGRGLCKGHSLLQTSPTECGVSECDLETSNYETKAHWGWQAIKTNFTLPGKFQTTSLELHAITVYAILNTLKCLM